MGELTDVGQQLLTLAGIIITGLFVVFSTVISVLIKKLLDKADETKAMIEPVSNGYAEQTTGMLQQLVDGYETLSADNAQIKVSLVDVKNEQGRMCSEISDLKKSDEALRKMVGKDDS